MQSKIELTLNNIAVSIKMFLAQKGIMSPEVRLERSSLVGHGDISSNVALRYAKFCKVSSEDFAQDIKSYLEKQNLYGIADIQVASPGFVNFFLNTKFLADILQEVLNAGLNYGNNTSLKGQVWVIEHTSPNPNKALHLGHLRNNLIGMSLGRLIEKNGAKVIYDAVDNNRGIAMAKVVYGFLNHMRKDSNVSPTIENWIANPQDWYEPNAINLSPDIFITKCYILGGEDFITKPDAEKYIRQLVILDDQEDKNTLKILSHLLDYYYQGSEKVLKRLGSHWDKVWHENEYYKQGKEYIVKGLNSGIFSKLNDGAVLSNLESYKLPNTILLKNDGTSLYITQDVALTNLKKKDYKADKLIWVVGVDQSLALRQLFAICEQLGIGLLKEFVHISYGYVSLKDSDGGSIKKMSSRKGAVVLIDDLIDAVKSKIIDIKKNQHPDEHNINDMDIEKMALAAIKFNILKLDKNKDMVFNIEQSIEINGDSGIYILYTYVRAKSILSKAGDDCKIEVQVVDTGAPIVKLLMFYLGVVQLATTSMSPHYIAQYLLDLCGEFNSWYAKETVIDNTSLQSHKLAIVKAVVQVIENGLNILNIQVVEKI